jgi:hypothetical protein
VPEVLTGNAHRFANGRGGVIERILRHLGLWQEGCACIAALTRQAERPSIRGSTTPSPTTTRTGHGILGHLKRPAAPKCAPRTPFSGPQAMRRQLCLTCGPIFVTLRFPLQPPGQRAGGLEAISYQSVTRERKSVVPVDTEAVSTAGSLLFKCGLSMIGFRTAR